MQVTLHCLAILTIFSTLVWFTQFLLALADHRRQTSNRWRSNFREIKSGVTVVIPVFNEKAKRLMEAVSSVLSQIGVQVRVIVVDDGSTIPLPFFDSQVLCIRLPENRGKRLAQAEAFKVATGDWIVTMDSDTVLDRTAIQHLINTALFDGAVAVSGTIKLANRDTNILTRVISLAYWYSYFQERASQAVFGAVAVCSGALSAYRREFVQRSLPDYATQTYLGRPIVAGDDRMLTTLALLSGHRTTWSPDAIGMTQAPSSFGKFLRQQIRWTRSFVATLPMIFARVHDWTPAFSYWLFKQIFRYVYHFAIIMSVAILCVRHATLLPCEALLIAVVIVSLIKGTIGYCYTKRPTFFLMPLWGIASLFVTTYVLVVGIVTSRNNKWGTR